MIGNTMATNERRISTNVIIFAPDKWGEVLKVGHFVYQINYPYTPMKHLVEYMDILKNIVS